MRLRRWIDPVRVATSHVVALARVSILGLSLILFSLISLAGEHGRVPITQTAPRSNAMDEAQTVKFVLAATAGPRIRPDAGLRSIPDAADRTPARSDPEPIRLAWEDREYGVWFKILQYETPRGVRWCHCYYASRSSDGGLMPNMQYTGRHHPAGLLTFGEATNLVILYAAGDKETCPRNECGYRDRPVTDQCRNVDP